MSDLGSAEQGVSQPTKVEVEPWARSLVPGESQFSPEQISRMKEILVGQGVVFHPKTVTDIPQISEERRKKLFGENEGGFYASMGMINKFLSGQPIVDPFGSDIPAREVWKDKMGKQYGKLFGEVFLDHNQTRPQVLGGTFMGLQLLGDLAKDPKTAREIKTTRKKLLRRYGGSDGEKYFPASKDQQLKTVGYFEQRLTRLVRSMEQK